MAEIRVRIEVGTQLRELLAPGAVPRRARARPGLR